MASSSHPQQRVGRLRVHRALGIEGGGERGPEDVASVLLDVGAQSAEVAVDGRSHSFGVLVPEACAAFDVRIQKSDSANRQIGHQSLTCYKPRPAPGEQIG